MKKYTIIFILMLTNCIYLHAQNQADSDFYNNKESIWLKAKTGSWNVIMTLQPTFDAKPLVVKKLEAKRTMVGAFCLHEVMQPTPGATMPAFERISDLDYNLNDAHWDYISIDTRITAGIMNFINMSNQRDSIVSYIYNFPHPGFGPNMIDRGKNTRVRNVIISVDADHDVIRQYWKLTDGPEWLAVTYAYSRKKI